MNELLTLPAVRTARVVSVFILTVFTLLLPGVIQAHEVTPSVSDLRIEGQSVNVDISLNVESFLAGIDLESLANTDESEGAGDYDRYRAMTSTELADAFRAFWPQMSNRFAINAPDPLALTLQNITVPPVGNIELPRSSLLSIAATLPSGAPGLTIDWPSDYGALIIRQQGVEEPYTGYLESGASSEFIAVAGGGEKSAWQSFLHYIPVGFDHILPKGLDHILFVLGLFFLSTRMSSLIWQISLFTVAHTVTLVMGALGWVNIPASIVEPLIAASIVYVACENIFTDQLGRWRTLLIFAFGLLHGLGFASVLGEFGLPVTQFIPALIGFNIGVELGQLTVVAIAFFAIAVWFRKHPKYRQWVAIPASVLIALTGAWWFVERVFL
ncbi:MAG: HupE/UreJ family protein [Pseudomonadota bacterium]